MKKFLAICLSFILMLCFSVSALAVGGFVSSPSANQAPEVVGTDDKDEDCTVEVDITPYAERDDLLEQNREEIEEAYSQIATVSDLGELGEAFKDAAKDAGLDNTALMSISELFDVSVANCTDHNAHGAFNATIKPSSMNNVVALMVYSNGKWSMVKNFKINRSKGQITFTAEKFGPYALVVSKDAYSPKTSKDTTCVAFPLVAIVASISVVVFVKSKKFEA